MNRYFVMLSPLVAAIILASAITVTSAGVFAQPITAIDKDTFSWDSPADVHYVRGVITEMHSYPILGRGSMTLATTLDTSGDRPHPGVALFYLVKAATPADASWQTQAGSEPGRDLEIHQRCSVVGPPAQEIVDAVDAALVGLENPWHEPHQFALFADRTEDGLLCSFDDTDNPGAPASQTPFGCGDTYCPYVLYCGPGYILPTLVSYQFGVRADAINHACFQHDQCYRNNCVRCTWRFLQSCCFSAQSSDICDSDLFTACDQLSLLDVADKVICLLAEALSLRQTARPHCNLDPCNMDAMCDTTSGECTPSRYATMIQSHSPTSTAGPPEAVLGQEDQMNTEFDNLDQSPGYVEVVFDHDICDGPGSDITVHLQNCDDEPFTLYKWRVPVMAWESIGSDPCDNDPGTMVERHFDLGEGCSDRFRLQNDLSDPRNPSEGPEVDAFEALQPCDSPVDFITYAIDGNVDELVVLDLSTTPVLSERIGPIGFDDVAGLAYDRARDVFFTADNTSGDLIQIDPSNANGAPVGAIGLGGSSTDPDYLGDVMTDLTFGRDAVLFGLTNGVGSTTRLITIDTVTGEGVLVGFDNKQLSGLAYDPESDRMFASHHFSGVPAALYEVDQITGDMTTRIGSLNPGIMRLADEPTVVTLLGFRQHFSAFTIERIDPDSPVEPLNQTVGNLFDPHFLSGIETAVCR